MSRLRDLLLPVDYSERCLDAADCARLLGSRSPVKVTVLHVTDVQAQRRADEEVIKAFSDRLAGFDVNFREVSGDPAEEIIEHSRFHPTDLIVMPTRGRRSLSRLLQGSITAKVLRGAACPVWTGVSRAQAIPKSLRIIKVACGVDLGPQSANVIRWAAAFADSRGARLAVIHASSQLVPMVGMVHDPEWRVHVANFVRAQLAELTTNTGVKTEIILAPGEPAAALAAAAEESGADVLVIGRTPTGFSRRLGSNAYSIIRRSPCPVVSIGPMAYCLQAPPQRTDVSSRPYERLERELALTSVGSAPAGIGNVRSGGFR